MIGGPGSMEGSRGFSLPVTCDWMIDGDISNYRRPKYLTPFDEDVS